LSQLKVEYTSLRYPRRVLVVVNTVLRLHFATSLFLATWIHWFWAPRHFHTPCRDTLYKYRSSKRHY